MFPPHYQTTIYRPNCKPYITTEIRRLIRHRDRLYKQCKIHKTDTTMARYKQARNNVVAKIRESLADYHQKQLISLVNDRAKNPKLFWKTLKSIHTIAYTTTQWKHNYCNKVNNTRALSEHIKLLMVAINAIKPRCLHVCQTGHRTYKATH